MFRAQLINDRLAMLLSSACAIHCFLTPSFVLLTSGLISISLDNELVHNLILFVAVPISIYALISGYANHKTFYLLPLGLIGLSLLVIAVSLGEAFFGELGEQSLTLMGSILVVLAHYKNHQACKELNCECHD
tara:strand:+ start:324 stop:722 length:399 start_codon:yes stop_codon:yes gene_type:complete